MITETNYNAYLSALLGGNKSACAKIVMTLIESNVEIKDLYTGLFQRSMYRIGELWEHNRISVATEHMATSITEALLTLVYPALFSKEHIGKKATISCGVNEFHQIGGRMVADIFELHGWDGYFLGANTPANDLVCAVDEKAPDLVGLSISIFFNMAALSEMIEKIRNSFPQLDIIVGGQAFRWGGAEAIKKYPNVIYVPSVEELEKLIFGFSAHEKQES
jgi:methanogenic corrinoid protein MtbC1